MGLAGGAKHPLKGRAARSRGWVSLAGLPIHQLDGPSKPRGPFEGLGHFWDHVLRPMWGQVARCEAQAYDAQVAL